MDLNDFELRTESLLLRRFLARRFPKVRGVHNWTYRDTVATVRRRNPATDGL